LESYGDAVPGVHQRDGVDLAPAAVNLRSNEIKKSASASLTYFIEVFLLHSNAREAAQAARAETRVLARRL
jgi:hypothetical protein